MGRIYHFEMYFRVACTVDDLTNKMCDEPIDYDLAQPFIAHVSIYKQLPTSEVPNSGPVLASCTTNLKLDDSEGLRDLTSAIAKSKDGVWARNGPTGQPRRFFRVAPDRRRLPGTFAERSVAPSAYLPA